MIFVHYENYRGGVNNLCVAYDDKTRLTATSTKGRAAAILNLHRKNTLHRQRERSETNERATG